MSDLCVNCANFQEQLDKCVQHLQEQLKFIRGSTLSIGLLDTIRVAHEGQNLPLNHLGYSQAVDRTIRITTFNQEVTSSVAKAIQSCGYNAYVFSKNVVVVSVPPASGEEKEKCRKHIDKLGESARIALRAVRAKARQASSKDEHKQIDKLADAATSNINQLIESKKVSL